MPSDQEGNNSSAAGVWGFLVLLYSPSLFFGFRADDFGVLRLDWGQAWARLWTGQFRPLWYFSYPATTWISSAAWFQHAVSLALFGGVLAAFLAVTRQVRIPAWWAVPAFTHPAFIWSVTWIAQRSDLLLLLFLLLAVKARHTAWGIWLLVLSNLSRSPFLFGNVWFAIHWWRAGQRRRALAALAAMTGVFTMSYSVAVAHHMQHSRLITLGAGLLLTAVLRIAKFLEGMLYAVLPFPFAFERWYFVPASALLAVAMTGLLWIALKKTPDLFHRVDFAPLALLMAIPFMVSSEPRVVAPVVPFLWLALGTRLGVGRGIRGLVAAVVASHLVLLAGSYRFSDTGCFVLAPELKSQCSDSPKVPEIHWVEERTRLLDRLLTRVMGARSGS